MADKPAFRSAFKRRRCLIPADGFFEWQKVGKNKQPYHFTLKDGGLFGFAGLLLDGDRLVLDPQLPASWRSLGFRLHWRGRRLEIRIEQAGQLLEATLEAGEPMSLTVSGEPHELRGDRTVRVFAGAPTASKAFQMSSD